MAGRATYTEQDKARVYVVLRANTSDEWPDGNVKRTSRESGVPENTVRRWRDEWKKNGPPDTEEVEAAVTEFVDDAERVRNLALKRIEALIPGSTKINELNNTVGILTDKLDRARGIGKPSGEARPALPATEELAALMGAAVAGAIQAAQRRQEEIVDADVIEQPALPQSS